jgi:hypothetical protein
MIVTLLVLGAVLLSILGIVALSIAPRRMFALDDSSIHTPAQLDAAMSIQRTMHIAELQRRTTDTCYLSYALLGLAFLMQMVALAVDHLAHLSIAVIGGRLIDLREQLPCCLIGRVRRHSLSGAYNTFLLRPAVESSRQDLWEPVT